MFKGFKGFRKKPNRCLRCGRVLDKYSVVGTLAYVFDSDNKLVGNKCSGEMECVK